MKQPTALGLSFSTAAMMVIFTLAFTAMMAGIYMTTKPDIDKSAEEEKLRLINDVLPPDSYDNKLLQDTLKLGPTPELGLDAGGTVYRARKNGQPAAIVMEAVAPDGYSGRIDLIIAIKVDGTVSGVRVTQHRETPGLGDYIDPKKDKNKSHPWITQFDGRSLATLPLERWKVKKDGGDFDYMTGATISPRAVVNAVAKAVNYANVNENKLFK
ncbi:MAG TPA: electron transport complex subunit RsxG [Rhodocyclaceae bacterium]|nr:electron transport complex subunit RsxG [Rhodocyclaceae bacterium]